MTLFSLVFSAFSSIEDSPEPRCLLNVCCHIDDIRFFVFGGVAGGAGDFNGNPVLVS